MDVIEKINYIISEQNIQKKEFVKRVQSLEPKLKSTGNIPSEQTIYGYLNGKRELKVELIPYIAEALNVKEQELFEFDLEFNANYDKKYTKQIREIVELCEYAPIKALDSIKNYLTQFKTIYNDGITK